MKRFVDLRGAQRAGGISVMRARWQKRSRDLPSALHCSTGQAQRRTASGNFLRQDICASQDVFRQHHPSGAARDEKFFQRASSNFQKPRMFERRNSPVVELAPVGL